MVYGDAQEDGKIPFLFELSNFCSSSNEPLLIGGDFNIISYAKERNSNNGVHRHTGLFNAPISFHELQEIETTGGIFTWSNNQDPPTLEKLDRILVSNGWADLYPQVLVRKLPREVSDHNPLIISYGISKKPFQIQFRFELSWMSHPKFKNEVARIWGKPCNAKSALDRIQQKLKLFKQFFKGWGFNWQGELRKRREMIQEELCALEEQGEIGGLLPHQLSRKVELLKENLSLLKQEETHWYNRSHENWLLKGDINTKFFHKCASGKRRKNTIITLEKDGETIEGDDKLLEYATEYYRELFGPKSEYDIQLDPSIWDNAENLDEDDNDNLCRPFSETDIKDALFQMERNKAPGLEKIPIEFYQCCWEIVREDIVELFDDFLCNKGDSCRLNYGIITLLPKIKEASKIQ